MAKPIPVVSTDSTGPIAFSDHRPRRSQPAVQRRRKPFRVAKSHLLAPSSTLLSLLAAVVSSSVAEGSPAPPTFLCPSIEPTPTPTQRKRRREPTPTSSTLPAVSSVLKTRTRTPQSRALYRSDLPHKYEQGEDGVWRKTDYLLYGYCTNCGSLLDGQLSQNNVSMPNNANSTTNQPDHLPPGWSPVQRPHPSHTTLILAMSLVLAFFICFLIIGCLFWRKTIRRKFKERDLEKKGKGKAKRKRGERGGLADEEEREIQNEKQSRAKMKLWARATARFKSNSLQSTRLRKGKLVFNSLRPSETTTGTRTEDARDSVASGPSTPPRSPPSSRPLSRRSSSASFHQEPANSTSDTATSANSTPIPTINLVPPVPSTSQQAPPAYQQKSHHIQTEPLDGLYAHDECTTRSLHSGSRRPSSSSFAVSSESGSGELGAPPIPNAHVATDDKAVLARLAELASFPPADESPESASLPAVSAPEWRDEELEDFVAQQTTSDDLAGRSIASSSLFPPPPSKPALMAPNFYDYPYSFEEDMASMEPEFGPSAPPFEEIPNSPLSDGADMQRLASAPPLIDDDDFYAPDTVHIASSPQPLPDGQDQDQRNANTASAETQGTTTAQEDLSELRGDEVHVLPVYRP
ncbi:hypothetical protein FA15DRAFT_702538 [Coprinopsis marcescibilis]|uniref:Uncharacterized protein n=1 Tax=Coprinopsis marcescibilis TaxID=230819 RepID=A0A5C3L1W1_COPMA|nr:hypothetical protein FA15DRAFT_702538 [Coprinopsis marcescibilis]